MTDCRHRLLPEFAIGIRIVDHADKAAAGGEETATGRDCLAEITCMIQRADRHDDIERRIRKRRHGDVTPYDVARNPILSHAMTNHSNNIHRDIEPDKYRPRHSELLRDPAPTETYSQ